LPRQLDRVVGDASFLECHGEQDRTVF
jgi:hypothetical protein